MVGLFFIDGHLKRWYAALRLRLEDGCGSGDGARLGFLVLFLVYIFYGWRYMIREQMWAR